MSANGVIRGGLIGAAALAVGVAAPGAAQDPPSLRAARLDRATEPIRVDGLLDEPAWRFAEPAGGLRQQEPLEGADATEETLVRVLYDDRALYIGVLARDREPAGVISRILQRDRVMEAGFDGKPRFAGDDAIAVLLDPFHDHRNAVVFATNPNGAEYDALITDEGRNVNVDWRGVWFVAARRTAQGWSAEFAIPFRTLRYPSARGEATWGFNVYRVIRRKNEEVLWSAWSRQNEGFTRVSRAGHLAGLVALPRAGSNLEVKPYTLAGASEEHDDSGLVDQDGEVDLGVDVKYEVRPGLLLDVTVNTDFAQVEVDDQQVNLTRFDLFFPEKRDFFLENAGIFEFGYRGFFGPPPFLLFFSRRIGIADDGAVPVIGGARLTGRVGRHQVGVLDIVTDSAFDQPVANFAVLRVKRDVGGSNVVGAMLTDRRSAHASNTAGGADFSLWPHRTLNLTGFLAGTASSGPGGDDHAYRLGADYQTARIGFTGGHLTVGPEATAESGFITREDYRSSDGFGRFTIRPRFLGLRRLNVYAAGLYATRSDGVLQDWNYGPAIESEWNTGETIVLYYQRAWSRVDEEFDLTDDVTVPPGDYALSQWGWFGSTSRNRPVVLGSQGSVWRFYGGDLVSVGATLGVAIGARLAVQAGFTRNDVEVPWGAFTADLGSLRVSFAASTRLFLNALVQYNSLDNTVMANVRLNCIYRPGSDLFIVVNSERGGSERGLWDPASRGAVVKLTYLARL